MSKLFLSYRRTDSTEIAGRICDFLSAHFGAERIFVDVDNIPIGEDFRMVIDSALRESDLLLVLIGDRWLEEVMTATGATIRRLDQPNDFVRLEIQTALKYDLPIFPVLVRDAKMPRPEELPADIKPLAYRNAATVRSGKDFRRDMSGLIQALEHALARLDSATSQDAATTRPPVPGAAVRSAALLGRRSYTLPIGSQRLQSAPGVLSGQKVGSYRIMDFIGSGGSSLVYRAVEPRMGREACIKISLALGGDSEVILRSVARGVRGVVALNHPNIIRIHDFDCLELAGEPSFFMVMELIKGATLDQWTRSLPESAETDRRRLRVAHRVAMALHEAHSFPHFDEVGFQIVGVLHGDLKPANIMVRAGDDPVVTDFMLVDLQQQANHDCPGSVGIPITRLFGTQGYMSPEQELQGTVSIASDIYAFGKTLGDLFLTNSADQVPGETRIIKRPWPRLERLLQAMVDPLLEKRPPTMLNVADELASAGAVRGVYIAGDEKAGEEIQFYVNCPATVKLGSFFQISVWVHLPKDREEVLTRSHDLRADTELVRIPQDRQRKTEPVYLNVTVVVNDLLAQQEEVIPWTGGIARALFSTHAPEDCSCGPKAGQAKIYSDGLQVATLHFIVNVSREVTAPGSIATEEKRHQKAYACYASADRTEVLARIQGMQKAMPDLEVFMDVHSLRAGSNWEEQLHRIILTSDVFYLFWSRTARDSAEVTKEWRYALEQRGHEFIEPVPLESPEEVPPPPELAQLHFNDWTLAFIRQKHHPKPKLGNPQSVDNNTELH